MSYYSNVFLANVKKCVNRAISIESVKTTQVKNYLIERCSDCNNPVPPCCDLQTWLSTLNAWDNTDNAVNGITEVEFRSVIDDINNTLSCVQPSDILTVSLSPISITVDPGDSITLTGAATGGLPPYTYQWKKNGVVLTGQTTPTLTLSAITGTDAGTYTLEITDTQNSTVTTNSAILTVTAVALAATDPVDVTTEAGQPATFTTVASGGVPPYTYQWRKGTTPITGATLASFTLASVVTGDAGAYRCVVTDSGSSTVTTNSATLIVNTSQVMITYGYSDNDNFVDEEAIPSIPNTSTTTIIHNASIFLTLPPSAVNKFIIVKVPSGESIKTQWEEVGAFNSGNIGDSVWRPTFAISGFNYYMTFNEAGFAFDSSHQIRLF